MYIYIYIYIYTYLYVCFAQLSIILICCINLPITFNVNFLKLCF